MHPQVRHRRVFGFTLVEMAIVLGVIGVLAAGLWNLMSGANQQMKDQSAATQQQQLLDATKAFLATPDGQNYMTVNPSCPGSHFCGPSTSLDFPLPLPSVPSASTAACASSLSPASMTTSQASTWCGYLPPGFEGPTGASPTTNPYGQSYKIQVLRDSTPNTGGTSPPNSYSFMIMTSGGNTIPDTDGSRISSLIGSDGGFIYTANVCGAPVNDMACGSYGGWLSNITAFGFTAASGASGTVATRTYTSPEQVSVNDWLARVQMPNDTTYTLNTMTVPEYLGDHALVMGHYLASATTIDSTNTIYMGDYTNVGLPSNGGTLNLQGGVINFGYQAPVPSGLGTINAQGGTINLNATGATAGGGNIYLEGGTIGTNAAGTADTSSINLQGSAAMVIPEITAVNSSTCTMTAPNVPVTCPYAVQATTINVSNLLNASALYAGTFIYSSSDRRLKKDIHPIDNTLPDIMQLKPVSFVFKSNDKKDLGLIAQDVEKIYPELVGVGSGGMKAVNYEGLIAPLVASVQELKKENDALRERISAQEAQQKKLEQELDSHFNK